MITTELIQKYFGTLEEFERFRLNRKKILYLMTSHWSYIWWTWEEVIR